MGRTNDKTPRALRTQGSEGLGTFWSLGVPSALGASDFITFIDEGSDHGNEPVSKSYFGGGGN